MIGTTPATITSRPTVRIFAAFKMASIDLPTTSPTEVGVIAAMRSR